MALIYFVNGSNVPVVNADSYADFNKIDVLLEWSPIWRSLSTPLKERRIQMATQHIDAAFQYAGERIDTNIANQTLEFPRDFGVPDTDTDTPNYFTIAEQKRRLLNAVRHIIDKSLTRLGANIQEYQGDGELIRQLQEHTPREVIQLLSPYIAK